ncbi:hypothetical protein JVU11DRAFT_3425 [Chiua virens]|nr:hypothetical protein JVU11DRAFT_3425 [Chiua virens]
MYAANIRLDKQTSSSKQTQSTRDAARDVGTITYAKHRQVPGYLWPRYISDLWDPTGDTDDPYVDMDSSKQSFYPKPTVAEISYFKASEDYKSGKVTLPLAELSKAPGLIKTYVGYQTEEPDVVSGLGVKEARDKFGETAEYAQIKEASLAAFASEPTVNYVEFKETKALDAPVTEFVRINMKEGGGKSMRDYYALVIQLHMMLEGTIELRGDSWAEIIGKPDVWHGILGWTTVKAHWDAVTVGSLKEHLNRMKEIMDFWIVHAELKAYSG